MSDDAIMRITGVTERDIRGVKNYGAKSPGEIFINYSIRKKQADVRNKAVTQLGGLDPQKAAEQIENNNVWDLIDSGATDEEIIAEMNDMSISSDSRFKFDEKKLAKIRKKGRVELEVGQKGRNTSRLSLQQLDEENKTLRDIFRFNLLLQKGEMSRDRDKLVVETNEFWKIESYLDRVSISSRFRNGEVIAIFEVSIFEEEELDKSELRDLLLNELV